MTESKGPLRSIRHGVAEATASAVLASAIVSTAGGVFWLINTLPSTINRLNASVQDISRTLQSMDLRFDRVERQLEQHEFRIQRLEGR